jgi:1-acyl-sn-glycerol-3-phosphate acyltransferase
MTNEAARPNAESDGANEYGLDIDRTSPPDSILRAVKRRWDGRYTVDPFGLDPQLADLTTPVVNLLVRVDVTGAEHVPDEGGAVIVANRGFGIFEPAALALAVRRATGRRLRVIGAPATPVFGALFRRLGAISDSARDLATCVRSGHLVAVPLAPTWLRTDAGMPPLPLMQAMTRAPAIPAAVTPGGPFGTPVRPWRVRFGPRVTVDEPFEPGDPLGAARLAEGVRDAVAQLLAQR